MRVAVIPARGGSKRIPRKNIKDFGGKPMIAWAIETAKASGLFEHIIVSTDDAEIAKVAITFGAEVPFLRPTDLSDDYAGTTEVITHAVNWMATQGWDISDVCCIYATAPLLQVDDIESGLKLLDSGDWEYTFSAAEFDSPIFRSFEQVSGGGVAMFFPEHFTTRSQDLPLALHDAGQFYWGKVSAWTKGKQIFDEHSAPVIIPRWRVQDIDTENDWVRAESIHNQIREKMHDK